MTEEVCHNGTLNPTNMSPTFALLSIRAFQEIPFRCSFRLIQKRNMHKAFEQLTGKAANGFHQSDVPSLQGKVRGSLGIMICKSY